MRILELHVLGRGREVFACFTALVCAVYSHRCIVVKGNCLNPAKLSRTLDGVDSRVTCMITCLSRENCKGVYHDRLTGTCGHYDDDEVFFGHSSEPGADIAMVHCGKAALRVVPIINIKFRPLGLYGSVTKACLDIGGNRLAKEDELVALVSIGAWYREPGWIYGRKKRFLRKSSQPGGKLKIGWQSNVGFCRLSYI